MFARKSENIEHIALADFFSTKGDELIEHRFGITQTAFRAARDSMRSRGFQCDFFFSGDELEMLRDEVSWDSVKIETLAP